MCKVDGEGRLTAAEAEAGSSSIWLYLFLEKGALLLATTRLIV